MDHASGMFPLVPANRSPLEVETRHRTVVGHVWGGFIKCFRKSPTWRIGGRKTAPKTTSNNSNKTVIITLSPINGGILHHHRFTWKGTSDQHQTTTNHLPLGRWVQSSKHPLGLTTYQQWLSLHHRLHQNLSYEIAVFGRKTWALRG